MRFVAGFLEELLAAHRDSRELLVGAVEHKPILLAIKPLGESDNRHLYAKFIQDGLDTIHLW